MISQSLTHGKRTFNDRSMDPQHPQSKTFTPSLLNYLIMLIKLFTVFVAVEALMIRDITTALIKVRLN